MANQEHMTLLRRKGVKGWNSWRAALGRKRRRVAGDLYRAELYGRELPEIDFRDCNLGECGLADAVLVGADFRKAYLEGADLGRANLEGAKFWRADLRGANLSHAKLANTSFPVANLTCADLSCADLRGADLRSACLRGANLWRTNLTGARLSNANLKLTQLVSSQLKEADLRSAKIYGASVWAVNTTNAMQEGLVITRRTQARITVDNLQLGQFLYLLLDNANLRTTIDSISSKIVLILGRFTPPRIRVLKEIKAALRARNYAPVLFDFDKPATRDVTETVATIAHLSKFIVADLTEAKSLPQELSFIVPNLPSVPVQPILLSSDREYGMFEHFRRYPWVLEVIKYRDETDLAARFDSQILLAVERKAAEIRGGPKDS